VAEKKDIPRAEALKYIASWRSELDLRQKELYSRLFGGAMGGVVTIVLSAGFALDKLGQAGWLVRVTLGLALLFLLLGAGNILNCFGVAVNGQLYLHQKERELTLSQKEFVQTSDLSELDEVISKAVNTVQRFYTYSYFCIAFAVIAGAITFFITLVRV
jgi:hypothetical protein